MTGLRLRSPSIAWEKRMRRAQSRCPARCGVGEDLARILVIFPRLAAIRGFDYALCSAPFMVFRWVTRPCSDPASQATLDSNPISYLQHVKYLASDELKGRGNGTPELERAAEYIAQQFQTAGLQPAGDNGTFFQSFQLTTGSRLGPNNRLTVFAGHQSFEAALRQDFVPIGIGDKTNIRGEVVFAGYGISAAEYNYDDYKNLDVTGKIVLVLAHEPRENDATSAFNGVEPTLHGHDNTKAINAKLRGARALLIVQDPANHRLRQPIFRTPADRKATIWESAFFGYLPAWPGACWKEIRRTSWIFKPALTANLAPQSFVLTGASVSLEVDVFRVRSEVRNVVGLLPGLDPGLADETIVLGAHYDHLGLGGRDSMAPKLLGQIHNGADDNASGTAGVVELARAFSRDHSARKRSYLFIAFAGEELGLHGSAFWTQHPTRPLEKVVAMLNLDMIGRSRGNHITLGGIGTSPRFPDLVKESAAESGIDVKTSQSGYGQQRPHFLLCQRHPCPVLFLGIAHRLPSTYR